MNSKINKTLQEHYDILVEKGYNVVGVFLYGSQNYELDYEHSDIDTKAIVLPNLEDLILNNQPVSTTITMPNNNQCDVKDIRKMFECYKKQNASYIETLFTKYYILNPLFKDSFMDLIRNSEMIARYNCHASVNCIVGMMLEKRNALCKPYPSIKEKVEKYQYDNKQLHHIFRLHEFLIRYISGESYASCLVSKHRQSFIDIKSKYDISVEDAISISDNLISIARNRKNEYIENNINEINQSVSNLLDSVMVEMIKTSLKG